MFRDPIYFKDIIARRITSNEVVVKFGIEFEVIPFLNFLIEH